VFFSYLQYCGGMRAQIIPIIRTDVDAIIALSDGIFNLEQRRKNVNSIAEIPSLPHWLP